MGQMRFVGGDDDDDERMGKCVSYGGHTFAPFSLFHFF